MARDNPTTITVEQAGMLIGLSRSAAYEAARRGEIPILRVGRRLLVPKLQLYRWLNGHTGGSGQDAGSV